MYLDVRKIQQSDVTTGGQDSSSLRSQRISRVTKETAAGLTRRMRNDAANDLLKHCRQWSQDKLPVRWAG